MVRVVVGVSRARVEDGVRVRVGAGAMARVRVSRLGSVSRHFGRGSGVRVGVRLGLRFG